MKNFPVLNLLALLLGLFTLAFTACNESARTTKETTAITKAETTDTTAATQDTSATMMDTAMAGGGMMGHMHQNMQEMQNMRSKMTGDPDYDFAQMMAMHHQGAVHMAEKELASGTDSTLKSIAQKTITANKAGIQKLQDFTKKHKPTTGDTATTMRMLHPMNKMMGQMHEQNMRDKNVDQNFAQMMIQHHQIGNEMAREFLKQGKTTEMKQMAQKTIDQQTKDIEELQNWQRQHPQ